jgi:cobalamin biosynthetic protein CobC
MVRRLNDRLMDRLTPSTSPASAHGLAHGGRLRQARRLFPKAPEPFIDLSTGLNPIPYPVPALAEEVWARLPEPEEIADLEAAAAGAYGVGDAGLVVAAPGTQSLIAFLPRLVPVSSVAILSPTYGEYARAFAAADSAVREIAGLDEIGDASALVLCNPNNPDGRRAAPASIVAASRAGTRLELVIVDESFADLEEAGVSLAPHLPQPGVFVLRSLSKSYGLGGLRLGFALAAPDLAASLRAALGPWPVSGPAIRIGASALGDRAWLEAARERLGRDGGRLDALLTQAGFDLIGGTHLFRLAASGRAAALFRRLGEAGILVRRFDYRPDWLRFGIPGSEQAWQRLARALA